jgi:hypothetical protein
MLFLKYVGHNRSPPAPPYLSPWELLQVEPGQHAEEFVVFDPSLVIPLYKFEFEMLLSAAVS